MRILLPFALYILLHAAQAQNWEIIQPGVNSKYQGHWYYSISALSSNDPLKSTINVFPQTSMMIGSEELIHLRRDQEITAFANLIFWGNPVDFIEPNQPGRFGELVIKSASGDYKFISYCGDTILIKTREPINQPWIFAPLRSGRYLEASIINMEAGSVLGMADSIKTVQIIARDSLGQVLVTDRWHQKSFRLSKHHGLISAPAFRFVNCAGAYDQLANDTVIYYLSSYKANNQWLGPPDTKLNEVFNIGIGDVFHFYSGTNDGAGAFSFGSRGQVIEKLISKTYYPVGDSMQLSFIRFLRDSSFSFNQGMPTFNIHYRHDTITRVIQLSKIRYVDVLDSINSDTTAIYFISFDSTLNGRIQVVVPKDPSYGWWGSPFIYILSCSPTMSQGFGYAYQVLAKDLGIVKEREVIPSFLSSSACRSTFRELVYFNRNGETWGNPFDTLAVLGLRETTLSREQIKVFPNPVKSGSSLHFSSSGSSMIQIFNPMGSLIGTYDSNEITIASGMYKPGIYFWQLEDMAGSIIRGKFLVE